MSVDSSKRVQITGKELRSLQDRIKSRGLADGDYDLLLGLTEAVERLSLALAERDASLGRMCKLIFCAPTETARNLLKRPPLPKPEEEKPKPKGHGRKPASAYEGAGTVTITHPLLKHGDLCPGCEKGNVYELAMPSIFVHIKGAAPLCATVYERTRLRCNLCGEIYTPQLPEDVKDTKYDDTATAMVAFLKYGCGLPLFRLQNLQASLGHPVPTSTQWDILNVAAVGLAPVRDAMLHYAAQGEIIHNDDTTMKVLSLLKEKDPESTRKGIFTTGLVSKYQDHDIAIFLTGNRHAGENLTELLRQRARGLSPPIQMCDAASRNPSKEFETIISNCLAHARRQFVEIIDRFPEDCASVIEHLGKVYHHDAIAKDLGLSPEDRLLYHQDHCGPVMADLHSWCKKQINEKIVEPNSGLGKAVNYMLNHWQKLTRFLQTPGAPLDNNLCERALKHAILHRKNALFYKTQRGAYVGDMFMTLIHTCQLAGVNPLEYLTWLLKNTRDLLRSAPHYMPWHYPGAQPT